MGSKFHKLIYKHKASGKTFLTLEYLALYARIPINKLQPSAYEVIENKKKKEREKVYLNEHKFD